MKRIISLLLSLLIILNTSLAWAVTITVKGTDLTITADEGDTVELAPKINEITGWLVKTENTEVINNQFTMPAGDVEIEAIIPVNKYPLTTLDVTGFNTDNVTIMGGMFYNCGALTTLDMSGFSTSKVTDMGNMFYNCSSLTSLAVDNFNTGKVTEMYETFKNCSSLTSLSVSNFNTTNVADLGGFARGCTSLTQITLGTNFGQSTNIPAPGYTKGAFYVSPAKNTTVTGANSVMINTYKWEADNRTVTFN